MPKEIQGFYYDEKKRRYFKIPSNSSFSNMPTVSNLSKLENQNDLEKRIKNSIDAVNDQQLFNGPNPKCSTSKFNSYDSILAAKFKEIIFNRNIYLKNLINFKGKILFEPLCEKLVDCPQRDLIIGCWRSTDDSGSCIAQLAVKDLLKSSTYNYKLTAKNYIDHTYSNGIIEDLKPIVPNDENLPTILLTLIRTSTPNQADSSILSIYHLPDLNKDLTLSNLNSLELLNIQMEFEENLFCCDNYLDDNLMINKFVTAGENKILLFDLSIQNLSNLTLNKQFNLKNQSKNSIFGKSIRFSKNGNQLCCGTNTGQLHLIDLVNNQNSQILNLNCKTIVDLDYINDNTLIVSAHNNDLFKIDLRYFKENNYLIKFKSHYNECRNLKFKIDRQFNTISSAGQDNNIRTWSIETGKLIHLIEYNKLIDNVNSKKYTNNYLLDDNLNQIFLNEFENGNLNNPIDHNSNAASCSSSDQITSNQRIDNQSFLKNYNTTNQYQIITSSDWKCLNKKSKPLMIGSISNSVDLFF